MMQVELNPYIVGQAIRDPKRFFGRHELLKNVLHHLQSVPEQNVLLLQGQRRIGKSSVINMIVHRVRSELTELFLPVSLDLMGTNSFQRLKQELLRRIFMALNSDPQPISQSGDNNLLLPKQTVESILAQLGDRRLLLLLDEFDYLGAPDAWADPEEVQRILNELRELSQNEKRLFFVFSVGRRLAHLPTGFKAIFKEGRALEIGLLNRAEMEDLVVTPARGLREYTTDARERIWELTSGHPFLTQVICAELFDALRDGAHKQVQAEDVEAIIDRALEAGNTGLAWFWEALPFVERLIVSALASAAQQRYPVSEEQLTLLLQRHHLALQKVELIDASNRLSDTWEILQPGEPGAYRFRIDLVRRWVAREHPIESLLSRMEATDPKATRLMDNANEAYVQERYKEAAKYYTEAQQLNEFMVSAHLGLARSLVKLKDFDKASEVATSAFRRFPDQARDDYVNILLQVAQHHQEAKAFETANRILQELLQNVPQHTEAGELLQEVHRGELRALLQAKAWFKAAGFWSRLHNEYPTDSFPAFHERLRGIWLAEATALTDKKDWAELNDLYDFMEELHIDLPEMSRRRGLVRKHLLYLEMSDDTAAMLDNARLMADALNLELGAIDPEGVEEVQKEFQERIQAIVPVPAADQPLYATSTAGFSTAGRPSPGRAQLKVPLKDLALASKRSIVLGVLAPLLAAGLGYLVMWAGLSLPVLLRAPAQPEVLMILFALMVLFASLSFSAWLLQHMSAHQFMRPLWIASVILPVVGFGWLLLSLYFGRAEWWQFPLILIVSGLAVSAGLRFYLKKKSLLA